MLKCDASSDFGFGAMVVPQSIGVIGRWSDDERVLARKSDAPDAGELATDSSTILELLALRNAISLLSAHLRGKRVQIEMDSQTSVQNLRRWDSEKLPILEIVNEIHGLVISFSLEVRFEFIPREFNEIADALSIDSFPQAGEMFEREFGSQLTLTSASRL